MHFFETQCSVVTFVLRGKMSSVIASELAWYFLLVDSCPSIMMAAGVCEATVYLLTSAAVIA